MKNSKIQYNTQGQKRCTKCEVFKDTSEFHKWSKAQDGLKLHCKLCVRKYDQIENDELRKFPRKVNEHGQIHCRNCGEYFEEDSMKTKKNGIYAYLTYCNECAPLLSHIRNIRQYGITIDQYHQMLKNQNYSCKICGEKDSSYRNRLSVDHDHSCCPGIKACGQCVRGLLCHHCNAALGNAKDSIERLQKMIDYLK